MGAVGHRYRWTCAEQMQLATNDGPPLAAPGIAFYCSDTGYILLGKMIDTVTRQSSFRRRPAWHDESEVSKPRALARPTTSVCAVL